MLLSFPKRGSGHCHHVAAGILPAVEGGILPPGGRRVNVRDSHSAGQDARLYGNQDGCRYARAAVVVPNGTLFGDGVCARIKEELLKEFNLHTIVRLPNGVFAPYTSIPTNILFFDRSGPTREVWYYEQPLPEGRKNYAKTQPLRFEEFAPCLLWWKNREENDRAWRVPSAELLSDNCNLDRKNPRAKDDITHLSPDRLAEGILDKERQIAKIMESVRELLRKAEV